MDNLFAKFVSRMDKCGKLDDKIDGIDESVFETMDLDLAEEAWNEFLERAFANCEEEIFIIKNHGYQNTSWPNRLRKCSNLQFFSQTLNRNTVIAIDSCERIDFVYSLRIYLCEKHKKLSRIQLTLIFAPAYQHYGSNFDHFEKC